MPLEPIDKEAEILTLVATATAEAMDAEMEDLLEAEGAMGLQHQHITAEDSHIANHPEAPVEAAIMEGDIKGMVTKAAAHMEVADMVVPPAIYEDVVKDTQANIMDEVVKVEQE